MVKGLCTVTLSNKNWLNYLDNKSSQITIDRQKIAQARLAIKFCIKECRKG